MQPYGIDPTLSPRRRRWIRRLMAVGGEVGVFFSLMVPAGAAAVAADAMWSLPAAWPVAPALLGGVGAFAAARVTSAARVVNNPPGTLAERDRKVLISMWVHFDALRGIVGDRVWRDEYQQIAETALFDAVRAAETGDRELLGSLDTAAKRLRVTAASHAKAVRAPLPHRSVAELAAAADAIEVRSAALAELDAVVDRINGRG